MLKDIKDMLTTTASPLGGSKSLAHIADIFSASDPRTGIQSGRTMIKAWGSKLKEDRILYAQHFIIRTLDSYWQEIHRNSKKTRRIPLLFKKIGAKKLDNSVIAVADAIGVAAAKLPLDEASFQIGTVYTALIPEETRSTDGVFYTSPALVNRLLDMAEKAGVNWATANVIDPACGGGAFLAPVCTRMLRQLKDKPTSYIIRHIQENLKGWEIDPFSAWMTQIFVMVALKDILDKTDIRLNPVVEVRNSLNTSINIIEKYNLVIGNPPYGKLKLTDSIKERYKESLFGHPNLYGLFTQLAIELCAEFGVVAYLTPTSWLSGEYFKSLRQFTRTHTSPVEIDFVVARKGVFEDALQETMLITLQKTSKVNHSFDVNEIDIESINTAIVKSCGKFKLQTDLQAPWILPRSIQQAGVARASSKMKNKLADWGYEVSTGPLVWNRHKAQLTDKIEEGNLPVIWAECITTDGKFILRSEKLNHKAYFMVKTDNWVVVKKPCILLQRTTAKEQSKRLIAAALPARLYKKGVVIENHLNMILARNGEPVVTPKVLSLFLNSTSVNLAFKCISGSVAVSAYELEYMPLPGLEEMKVLEELVDRNASRTEIDEACRNLYQN